MCQSLRGSPAKSLQQSAFILYPLYICTDRLYNSLFVPRLQRDLDTTRLVQDPVQLQNVQLNLFFQFCFGCLLWPYVHNKLNAHLKCAFYLQKKCNCFVKYSKSNCSLLTLLVNYRIYKIFSWRGTVTEESASGVLLPPIQCPLRPQTVAELCDSLHINMAGQHRKNILFVILK